VYASPLEAWHTPVLLALVAWLVVIMNGHPHHNVIGIDALRWIAIYSLEFRVGALVTYNLPLLTRVEYQRPVPNVKRETQGMRSTPK
jgi:hypothetical protein